MGVRRFMEHAICTLGTRSRGSMGRVCRKCWVQFKMMSLLDMTFGCSARGKVFNLDSNPGFLPI